MLSEHEDAFFAGLVPLAWTRAYSTALLPGPASPLGWGWTSPFFAELTRDVGGFTFHNPEGAFDFFDDSEHRIDRGQSILLCGAFSELARDADRFVVTRWTIETCEVTRYVFQVLGDGAPGPLLAVEDAARQGIDVLRSRSGTITGLRQRAEGRVLSLEYDSPGLISRVSAVTRADRRIVLAEYKYDALSRLVSASNALGYADRYEYDEAGRVVRETAMDGGVFTFAYDSAGRCVRTAGRDGYDEKSFRYYDHIAWTEVTNSRGSITRFHWNPAGQVLQTVLPSGATTRTDYDEHGRITAITAAHGGKTFYGYDERGNRTLVRDPLGHETYTQFDDEHQPTILTDAEGHTWKREYDADHRLVAVDDPVGARWSLSYDSRGLITQVRAPNNSVASRGYSPDGLLTHATDFKGARTRFEIDDFGQVVRRQGPKGDVTTFTYDLTGNPVRMVLADGSTISCSYDGGNNLISATDGESRQWTYHYASCHRLLRAIDPDGTTVSFDWGTEPEQLLRAVNGDGNVYSFEYGADGEVVSETGFDGTLRRYVYSGGRCVARINAAGQRIDYQRDAKGQLTARLLADGTAMRYSYDGMGRLATALTTASEVQFTHDPHGRVVRERHADMHLGETTIERHYDVLGSMTAVRTSLGHTASYLFDANGWPSRLVTNADATFDFHRDLDGLEVGRSLPGGLYVAQERDAMGRLTTMRVTAGDRVGDAGPESPVVLERSYAYDKSGGVVSVLDSRRGQTRHAYDAAGRLARTVTGHRPPQAFDYDRAGNLTSASTSQGGPQQLRYGPGDRLTRHGDATLEYDEEGRLSRRVERGSHGPQTWQYAWDALGQLTSVERPDGMVWHYRYDAVGRRIEKRCGTSREGFVWDANVIVHHVSADREISTWVYDPDTIRPLCRIGAGQILSVLHDQFWTPNDLVDADGRVWWSATHHAWGAFEADSDSRTDCELRFPGQWFDPESGLHYNRFRYFDPEAGRYVSPDPQGFCGGLNTYQYAPDPVNWFDSLGLNTGCGPGTSAAAQLPPLKGKPHSVIRKILSKAGFTSPGPSPNSSGKNERWTHPDGSQVLIHPYGNQNQNQYKTANNGHVHKVPPGPGQPRLNDRGQPVAVNSPDAHIGISNPPDLPQVRGRPHGAGTQ